MAKNTKHSERERYRYGLCLNDECERCKAKEIQKIPMRKDFICQNPNCGKELRECPPPKKSSKLYVYIFAGILGVGVACCVIFLLPNSSVETKKVAAEKAVTSLPENGEVGSSVKSDTVVVHDTVVKNNSITTSENVSTKTVVSTTSSTPHSSSAITQPKLTNNNSSTIRLSYGSYSGATKSGFPHGQGKLTYSRSRQINRNDIKGRIAHSGDYVIGEFFNGFVVYGKHYDASGNLLESLNFGIGSESSYEEK